MLGSQDVLKPTGYTEVRLGCLFLMGYVNKVVHRNQDVDKAGKHEKERVQGNRKRTGKMPVMGLRLFV